jgi:7-cyano-7-deazaguanine reductase
MIIVIIKRIGLSGNSVKSFFHFVFVFSFGYTSFLKYIERNKPMAEYSEKEARAGLDTKLPPIEIFPNQFSHYEIRIEIPEFTSVCPKTGLPDFGILHINYSPDKSCLELKALKMYLLAYRNLGIFYENAVNRILDDIVEACRPVRAVVAGEFNPRGGIKSVIEARYPRLDNWD